MFNKKRILVFVVFILFMFLFITFAGGTPQNQAIATRLVTFIDGYDNTQISQQKVVVGEDAEVPEDPKHDAMVFAGWYLKEDRKVEVTDFTNILKDLTVVAEYAADRNRNGIADEKDQYFTVRFVDTYNNSTLSTQRVLIGTNAVAPRIPIHNGMTFVGWSRSYTNVKSNITVNTVYRANTVVEEVKSYSVTFIDGETDEIIETVKVDEGLSATTPEPPKHDGLVFDYWEGNYSNVSKDETVKAVYASDVNENDVPDYQENKYTVTYDKGLEEVNGEVPVDENEYLEGLKYVVKDKNTLAMEKAVFLGWSEENPNKLILTLDEEKALILARPEAELTIADSSVEYYAVWAVDENENEIPDYNEDKFTVEFIVKDEHKDLVEGTLKFEEILTGMKFYDEVEVPTIKEVKDDELAFDKWNPVLPEEDATVTEGMTFEAVFAEDKNNNEIPDANEEKYSVTYEKGLESVTGEVPTDENEYLSGLTYKVLESKLTNEKTVFIGWSTTNPGKVITTQEAEDALTLVQPGAEVAMGEADVTYYAVWASDENGNSTPDYKDEKFTVEFTVKEEYKDLVEGTLKFEEILTGMKFYDEVKVPTIKEVKDDELAFDKWNPVLPEEDATVTEKMTFEAVFAEDKNNNEIPDANEDKYKVEFVAGDNGTLEGTLEYKDVLKDLTFGNQNIIIPTPKANEHYKFVKWDVTPSESTVVTGDMKFTASFEAVEYTVTFVDENGKTVEVITYNIENTKINEPVVPTKAGYVGVWEKYDITNGGNVTVKPVYTANTDTKYTVEYYKENLDGSYAKTSENKTSTTDTKVNAEIKEFTGFTHASTNTNNVLSGTVAGDGSLVLKVYYTRNSYKLTYVVDKEIFKEETYKYEQDVTTIATPAKDGYTFSGWDNEVPTTMPANDVTLNGSFTANKDTEYTVEYYKEKLDGTFAVESETKTSTTDTTVNADVKTFDGFTHDSANTNNVLSGTVAGDGSLVLKVYYTRNSYKITYVVDKETVKVETYKYEASVNPITDPTKIGYTFSGWDNIVPTTMPANDVTLSGNFTANGDTKYVVEYYTQNLDGTYAVEKENKTAATDSEVEVLPKEIVGFTYDSANTSNILEGTVAGDGSLVLKVYYTRNSYKLTYVVDNETVKEETYKYEENVTAIATPEKVGYTFSGWDNVIPTTMPAEDLTLSGSFAANKDTEYTVEYYKEKLDGTFAVESEVKNATTDTTANAEIKTFDGFTYDSVNTNNVLSGTVAGDGSLVLKVYYTRNSYKLTYVVDNETVKEETYKYEQTVTAMATPVKAGYTFSGWDKTVPTTMPAENVTVSGSFTANKDTEYTVEYYKENLDGTFAKESETKNATTDTKVNAEIKEFTGFTHASTNTENVLEGTVAGDGSLVLKVYYTRNSYKLTYVVDKETVKEETYKYEQTVTAMATPVKAGYTFSGWDKTVPTTMPAEDVTVSGSFTANKDTKYTVEYYKENLDGTFAKESETKEAETDTEVEAEIKEFTGFTHATNNTNNVLEGTVAGDGSLVLKVYYTRNSYKLTYVVDNETVKEETYKYEENVTAIATPVKAGYTFSGWDKTVPTTMPAENVTVSGSFTANTNTEYTIEYYTENTDGTFSLNSSETKTATTGTTVSATAKEIAGFAYDSSNTNNVLSGTVAGDGSLVLKLYYNKIKAPNVSVTVESNITRDGEAVTGGIVEYGDVLNYTVTIKNTGDADGSVLLKDIVTGKLEDITVADEYKALFETSGLTIVVKPNETITITFSGTVKTGVNEKVKNDISYSVNGGETTTITGTEYDTQKTISFVEKTEIIQGTNIVIVLDESASMDGDKFATAKDATNSFISQVFPSANNNSNGSTVAVVTFGTQEVCLKYGSVLTFICVESEHQAYANVIGVTATDYNSATSLKNSISGLSNDIYNSGTPYYIGLQNAYNILYNETNGLYKNGNKNVVIFLSDGAPDSTDDETQRNTYINNLKSKGTDIYAIGFDIAEGTTAHTTLGTVANKGVFIAGTDDLTNIFSTIHSSIADNNTSKQTSQGVAEIADTIVIDESHPINIKVNGVDNKYYSVDEVLATGYLTYTSEDGYEVDATKFAAGDVIEVIYFAEVTNTQALTRSSVAYSYGSLVSRARVQETPAPTAPEETVEEPTEEVVEEPTEEVVEEPTEEVVEEPTEEVVEEPTKEVVEEPTEEVVEEPTEEVVEEPTEEVVEEPTEVIVEEPITEVIEESTEENEKETE